MTISDQLTRYADELDSGRWRQIFNEQYDDTNGRCATGVWLEIHGLYDIGITPELSDAIVAEVHRLRPDTSNQQSIPGLNDYRRIPFSIFAQAARTVAWRERLKEQERSYGSPIVVVEDADRLVAV